MNDDDYRDLSAWEMICNLNDMNYSSNTRNWGYEISRCGKKILAKKFEFEDTLIFDFNVYRLEKMIDDSWEDPENHGTDAYILAEILEAYLGEEVALDWAEGFPMAYPLLEDYDDF